MDRFPLGRTVATPGALEALGTDPDELPAILRRHQAGDWGDLSAYRLASGARVWIITEADRSATTILLPSEY